MSNICAHGQLARSCNTCEDHKEILKLRAELARVRETLSDLYHQYKCGCGHPACRQCGRDRDAEAALSQPAEQTTAQESKA